MNYLIAYGIGFIIMNILLMFVQPTKVKSLTELIVSLSLRMIFLPLGIGLTLIYLFGK